VVVVVGATVVVGAAVVVVVDVGAGMGAHAPRRRVADVAATPSAARAWIFMGPPTEFARPTPRSDSVMMT
jgi:hypothetical protein